jgi:nucleoid-associated protein YgaU
MLAQQFYGDATQWWIIAAANGLGKGTLFTPENVRLRIPDSSTQQDYIDLVNSER